MALATLVVAASPAFAGRALVDLLDVETLEQAESNVRVAPERVVDLLVIEMVRERVAAGALTWTTTVAVRVVAGDAGPSLAAHPRLTVGELLQLALLTRSRGAVASLAAAAGPGWERARARLRRTAIRLELTDTPLPDGWPSGATHAAGGATARTTVADVARAAAAVASDPEIRRRLALDGTPIADGALIVRATDPLIALAPPSPSLARPATAHMTASLDPDPALALMVRDGLELLAVASGGDAASDVWQALERGVARYRRVELVRAGEQISAGARDGVRGEVTPVAAQAFSLTVPRTGQFSVNAWVQRPGPMTSPRLESNQLMGELMFEHAGRIIGAVPLVAPSSVAPNGWLDTARR